MQDDIFNIKARHSFEGIEAYNYGYKKGVEETISKFLKFAKDHNYDDLYRFINEEVTTDDE